MTWIVQVSDSSLKQIMEWLITVEEAKSVHINNYLRERKKEREIFFSYSMSL